MCDLVCVIDSLYMLHLQLVMEEAAQPPPRRRRRNAIDRWSEIDDSSEIDGHRSVCQTSLVNSQRKYHQQSRDC